MILRRISLKNIKSYYGEHSLEFPRPTYGSIIHLLGARNGSGKTTLFDAINACLFASESNPILRANDLSRGLEGYETEMAVELEFEHEHELYQLRRSWMINPRRPDSSANSVVLHSLLHNLNTRATDKNNDSISEFIDTLMPQSISRFFLFDGEQIQEYTDAAADSVRDALERLLGLSIYLQLQKDLGGRVETDFRKDRDAHDVQGALSEKIQTRDSVQAKLDANRRNRRQANKSATEVKRELERLGRQDSQISLVFDEDLQARRRELVSRRDSLQGDVEDKKSQLKGMISRELVVAMFYPQLQQAAEALSESAGPFELEELIGFLWDHREDIAPTLGEETPESLENTLMSATGANLQSAFYASMSEGIRTLNDLVENSRNRLLELPRQLDGLMADLAVISHELEALPSPESIDTDVAALHQEMEKARSSQARLESSLSNMANEERDLNENLRRLENEISTLSSEDRQFRRLDAQLNLCRKIQDVLEQFITDYRRTRIRELRDVFNRKFRDLTNSPETLGVVDIDEDTFDINIITRTETGLAASEQSAGQKEVMAFALIASIVELSNKQLPIIIDTPLARLDTVHKDNILTKFFPYVGHQVFVLSTDTEIGFTQHQQISPYIASEHHLVRDAETGQTSIKEGYLVQ